MDDEKKAAIVEDLWEGGWRASSMTAAVLLTVAVLLGLLIDGCYGQDESMFVGFSWCADEFDNDNRLAFAVALALSPFVGPLFVLPFIRRLLWLGGASLAIFLIVGTLVVINWP
jgi:hypothetical protein